MVDPNVMDCNIRRAKSHIEYHIKILVHSLKCTKSAGNQRNSFTLTCEGVSVLFFSFTIHRNVYVLMKDSAV